MTDLALAVDLGGTKVEAALVDEHGELVHGSRHRAPTGRTADREELADAVTRTIRRALDAAPADSTLIGGGVGSAGPIDLEDGRVSPKNLPALDGFNLRGAVARELGGRPVTLRLDGTCIALAEHWRGAAAGFDNSMSMIVSTGVGGGLILDDAIVTGRSGNAGHVGQIHVAGFGGDATNPHSTTLEGVASGLSTVLWAQQHGWVGNSGEDLAASCAAGDTLAWQAVRRSADAVGQAIASTTTLLDLDVVVIGGGFASVVPDYVELVHAAARRQTVFPYAAAVQVRPALLAAAPLIGAAALALRPSTLARAPLHHDTTHLTSTRR